MEQMSLVVARVGGGEAVARATASAMTRRVISPRRRPLPSSPSTINDDDETDELLNLSQRIDRTRRSETKAPSSPLHSLSLQANDFDDLYLRFSYVMGKDWEICAVRRSSREGRVSTESFVRGWKKERRKSRTKVFNWDRKSSSTSRWK